MSQSYDSLLLGLLQAANAGAFGFNQTRPSEAQCFAGNYKVGRWQWGGLTLAIEQPEGSIREKTAKDGSGKTWRNVMGGHYGYIVGTKGNDGDAVDCFIGQDVLSPRVFVINQGFGSKFDEHKVMLCYDSADKAKSAYLRSYAPGWQGLQAMHECSIKQLHWWLFNCDTKKPFNPAHLPFEGAPAMQQRTYWDENALPISTTLDAVLAAIQGEDSGDGLLLDSVTEHDILSDPENQAVLTMDALVTEFVRLDRRMLVMERVMNRVGSDLKIAATQVTKPFKQRGIVNVAVIFELSDGQTISVYFHNPDAKTTKVAPNDEIISWKWLLNKKDVTIWVAPERGKDLQVQEVGRRLMKLASKNSDAFKAANEKRAQRLQEVQDLSGEVEQLQQELDALLAQIETVKAQIELAEEAQANAKKLAAEFASNPKPKEPLPNPKNIENYDEFKAAGLVLITDTGSENLYFTDDNGQTYYTKVFEPDNYTAKVGQKVDLAADYMALFPDEFQAPQEAKTEQTPEPELTEEEKAIEQSTKVMAGIAHELGLLGWLVTKTRFGYEMHDPYRGAEFSMMQDGRDEERIEMEATAKDGVQVYTDAYPDSDPKVKARELDKLALGAWLDLDDPESDTVDNEESEFYGKHVEWVKARLTLEKAAKSVGCDVLWGDFNASLTTGGLFDAAGGYDDLIAQIGADGIVIARASISQFGAVTLYKGADGEQKILTPAADAANTSESEIKAALLAAIEGKPEPQPQPEPEPQSTDPSHVLRVLVDEHGWEKYSIGSAKKYFVGVAHGGQVVPDGGRNFYAIEGNETIIVRLGDRDLVVVDLAGLTATQAAQQVEDKAQAAAQKMRDELAAQAEKDRIAREEKRAYQAKVNATRESIGHRFARCSDKFYLWLADNPKCIPVAVALDKEFAQYDNNKDTHVTVYWQEPKGATLDSAAWGDHADIGAGMWALPEPDLNEFELDELVAQANTQQVMQAVLDAAYEVGGSVCGTVRMGFENYALIQLNADGTASIFDKQGQPFATPSGESVAAVTAQTAATAASEVVGAAPVPQIPENLTPVQLAVLLLANGYKSAFRKKTAERYGIGGALYDDTVRTLNEQGVYLKRSAITAKGREAIAGYYEAGGINTDAKMRMLKATINNWLTAPQAPQTPVQDAPAAPVQDAETDPENQPPYYTQQPQPVFAVGDYLLSAFPSLNKRSSLTDYMTDTGSTYEQLCKVEKVLTLSPAEFDQLAENLLADRNDLGEGGSATESPYLDNSIFRTSRSDMSSEMLHEVESTLYSKATIVQAKGRKTFVIDAQGYTYARYIGLNPVKTSAPAFGAAPKSDKTAEQLATDIFAVESDRSTAQHYGGMVFAKLLAVRDQYGRDAVREIVEKLIHSNLNLALEILKRAGGNANSLGGVIVMMPKAETIVDAVMDYQWKGLQLVKQEPEAAPEAAANPDIDYLNSVIAGSVGAADVDLDALEAMYARNSDNPDFEALFNRVLDIVQNAEDQATKDL